MRDWKYLLIIRIDNRGELHLFVEYINRKVI